MPLKQYTMTRTGYVKNERMCGLEGTTIVDYQIQICVEDLTLDRNGFMIDHQDIHSLIKLPLSLGMSCEVGINNAMRALAEHFTSVSFIAQRMTLRWITIQAGMRGGDAHFTLNETF